MFVSGPYYYPIQSLEMDKTKIKEVYFYKNRLLLLDFNLL